MRVLEDGFNDKENDNGFIGVVVLCRHYMDDTYSWNVYAEDDRITGYLESMGWKSEN